MILMDLNEQVDWDFVRARRKAWLSRLLAHLRREPNARTKAISFDEIRRSLRSYNRVRRGRRIGDPEKIVGSVGRREDFDRCFMPLSAGAGERWKRVDLAYYKDQVLPPVSLYKLGDAYFVEDGNHRVSVARYHGVGAVEAYVTEFRPARAEDPDADTLPSGPVARAA
jgi:hypothetical protein